jgi:hypothetical protein
LIRKGKVNALKSNAGRHRLNVNGAINIETLSTVVDYGDSLNAQSTISLFKKLESKNPDAEVIYTVCGNTRYYRSALGKVVF